MQNPWGCNPCRLLVRAQRSTAAVIAATGMAPILAARRNCGKSLLTRGKRELSRVRTQHWNGLRDTPASTSKRSGPIKLLSLALRQGRFTAPAGPPAGAHFSLVSSPSDQQRKRYRGWRDAGRNRGKSYDLQGLDEGQGASPTSRVGKGRTPRLSRPAGIVSRTTADCIGTAAISRRREMLSL